MDKRIPTPEDQVRSANEAWRGWRIDHAGLSWRLAVPEDAPALEALFEGFEAKYGKQDRPDLFDMPVIITLIAEEHGFIIDCFYVELVADITKITTNRSGFDVYEKMLPYIAGFLGTRKVRIAQMAIERHRSEAMEAPLEKMGFARTDLQFTHWVRRVRPE